MSLSSSSLCPKHPSLPSVGACAFCLKERLDLLADAEMPAPLWPSFVIHETQPDTCSQLDLEGYGSSAQSLRSHKAPHSANSSVKPPKRAENRARMADISHSHQLCVASGNSGTSSVHSTSSRSILDARRTLSGLEASAYRSVISTDACPVNRRNSLSFLLSINDGEDRSAAKITANPSGALTDKQSGATRSQRRCKYFGSLSDRFGFNSSDALLCGSNDERSASRLSSVTFGGRKASGWKQKCRECCSPADRKRHCCHDCENCKQPWQESRPSSWEGLWLAEPPKYSLSHDSAFLKTSARGSIFSKADILCNGSLRRTGIVCTTTTTTAAGSHGPKLGSQHCSDTVYHHNGKNGRAHCFGDDDSKTKKSSGEDSLFIRADLSIGEGGGSQHMLIEGIKKCRDGLKDGGTNVYGEDESLKEEEESGGGGKFFNKFSSRRWQEMSYLGKKNGGHEFGGSMRYSCGENETYFARRMLQDACTQTTPSRSSDAESHEDRKLPFPDHHHHHQSTSYINTTDSSSSSTPTLWHKLWSKTSKWASRHSKHQKELN